MSSTYSSAAAFVRAYLEAVEHVGYSPVRSQDPRALYLARFSSGRRAFDVTPLDRFDVLIEYSSVLGMTRRTLEIDEPERWRQMWEVWHQRVLELRAWSEVSGEVARSTKARWVSRVNATLELALEARGLSDQAEAPDSVWVNPHAFGGME